MVKAFRKNTLYTLCLATETKGELITFVRNVSYNTRIDNILEFNGCEYCYTVDIDTKLVTCTNINNDNEQYFYTLINIVKGWQY